MEQSLVADCQWIHGFDIPVMQTSNWSVLQPECVEETVDGAGMIHTVNQQVSMVFLFLPCRVVPCRAVSCRVDSVRLCFIRHIPTRAIWHKKHFNPVCIFKKYLFSQPGLPLRRYFERKLLNFTITYSLRRIVPCDYFWFQALGRPGRDAFAVRDKMPTWVWNCIHASHATPNHLKWIKIDLIRLGTAARHMNRPSSLRNNCKTFY